MPPHRRRKTRRGRTNQTRHVVHPLDLGGFTLIEMLIAIAVVALLASIAYPSFVGQVNRSRVATAIADIADMQIALERYCTNTGVFPDDLSPIAGGKLDPWGNPYQYLNMVGASTGKVRKDKALHPLNTDYDLYSMGADGKSSTPLTAKASQDDVIRAGDGSFIGLASNF